MDPSGLQASLNNVPGHIRRRQKRKARRAGLTNEADTDSENDEPPTIIKVNEQWVHQKYNWETDELHVPGYIPEVHLKIAMDEERM